MKFRKFVSIFLLLLSVFLWVSFTALNLRKDTSTSGELIEFSCVVRLRGDHYKFDIKIPSGEHLNFGSAGLSCNKFKGVELDPGAQITIIHKVKSDLVRGLVVDGAVILKPEDSQKAGIIGGLALTALLLWLSYYYWRPKRLPLEAD
ncbi:hypothetical protein [Zhongshania arctica]|uniref:Uncharacterized protein n=1 Tax=Zhongshania arctica TaxID=3238302 RepID=A0ABV3TYE3_9GAMM